MYRLWFAEAPTTEYYVIKSSFMHSPALHHKDHHIFCYEDTWFHGLRSGVEGRDRAWDVPPMEGRYRAGPRFIFGGCLASGSFPSSPWSRRREPPRTQPPLALVLQSTDASFSRVGQNVLQAYESIVHCSRLKRKYDPIPEPSQTIANFVAAISRASTSGVNRAKAFFDPSGLWSGLANGPNPYPRLILHLRRGGFSFCQGG